MRIRSPFLQALCIAFLAETDQGVAAQSSNLEDLLRRFDADLDSRLDRSELTAFFLANDRSIIDLRAKGVADEPLRQEAELRSDDTLSYRCGSCLSVPIDQAAAFVRETIRLSTARRFQLGWRGLSFRRFATDPADARQLGPDRRPALFSYRRDSQAKDQDQVNWLGGLQFMRFIRNLDQGNVRRHFLVVTPAVEADIDGSRAANESSLDCALPVTYRRSPEIVRPICCAIVHPPGQIVDGEAQLTVPPATAVCCCRRGTR